MTEKKSLRYLMLDHGGVLDGEVTRVYPEDKDLLIGEINPGLYQVLKNGVEIIQDLNKLVNEHGYGIAFHSKNKEDKQVRLLKDIREASQKKGITFPKVCAMPVRDADLYKDIDPKEPSVCFSSCEQIPVLGYDKEMGGKSCVRAALAKYLGISETARKLHYAFDDGPLVISKAKEDGWSAYLIGNNEEGVSLDAAIAQILKKETKMSEAFGTFIEFNEKSQPEQPKVNGDHIVQIPNKSQEIPTKSQEIPSWKQKIGPSEDKYRNTKENRKGRNYFSCGIFENLTTKEKWIGKSNCIDLDASHSYAVKQRIAADIYSRYGVITPRIEISLQNPINTSFSKLESDKETASMHIMTEIIPDFTTYRKACGSQFKLTGPWFEDGILLKTGERIAERGLGAILAVALFIDDKSVVGLHGNNVGFIKKKEGGKDSAQSVKIDPYEPFDFEDQVSSKTFPISYVPEKGVTEKISYDELPERTKTEFKATLQAIAETTEDEIREIFDREGTEPYTADVDFSVERLLSRRKDILKLFEADLNRS